MKIAPLIDRWPRTALLVIFFLCAVVALGLVHFFGIYGPTYLGVAGVIYIAISAVLGDIKDRKEKP